jgi:thiol:disulfide interchange protein
MLGAIRRNVSVLALALALAAPATLAACKRGCLASGAPPTESSEPVTGEPGHAFVRVTPNGHQLTDIARDEAKKAKARGLAPYLELRADWCGPCRKLEASEHDPRIVDAFAGTYIIRVDVDEAGGKLGPYRASAIPVFFEVGDDGRPTGRKIDGSAWGADTPESMAPPLKAFFHPGAAARHAGG